MTNPDGHRGGDAEALARIRSRNGGGRILIKGAAVVSVDPEIGDLAQGDILISGSEIEAVAPDLSASAEAPDTVVVDAEGCIAIPGMQDTHRHSWQTQVRRVLSDGGFGDYLQTTHAGVGPHYRPEDIYIGNKVAALTALDQGITTVLDFSHNCLTHEHLTDNSGDRATE